MARIKQLYAVEHEAKDLDASACAARRQEKSGPRLAAMKDWLDSLAATALPKSSLGEAVTYARNQWTALTVYTTDSDLAIDNNTAERAMKLYALKRKNWLFFGSDRGAQTLAILSRFTATCRQFGIHPWNWLTDTLTQLRITPPDQLPSEKSPRIARRGKRDFARRRLRRNRYWRDGGLCGSRLNNALPRTGSKMR